MQTGWAIIGTCGFYIGWWHTRREAINAHTEDLYPEEYRTDAWRKCRAKGDRAVRVEIRALEVKEKD